MCPAPSFGAWGGLRYRCAVRTVVRALVLLHFFILFAGHLQEWKLVSGLLGSWIRPLAASISAAFRVAPCGCPLFVAGPVRFVSLTLFDWSCGVGGGARLSYGGVTPGPPTGAVALVGLVGSCRPLRGAWCIGHDFVTRGPPMRATFASCPSGARGAEVVTCSFGFPLHLALRLDAAGRDGVSTVRLSAFVASMGCSAGSMGVASHVYFALCSWRSSAR